MLVRSHAREPQMLDLLDRILDKGIVIDVWAQVILAGIDLGLRFEVRMVVASIETYLKRAGQLNTRDQLLLSGKSEASEASEAPRVAFPSQARRLNKLRRLSRLF